MTKMNRVVRCFLLCCALMAGMEGAVAQRAYMARAAIEPVNATGFYMLQVTPELSAWIKADLSDIRIADSNKAFVPYFTRNWGAYAGATEAVIPAGIISNTTERNFSSIIIERGGGQPTGMVSGISFVLQNAAVERYAALSGSNDNVRWFIIDDHVLLQRSFEEKKWNYTQFVNIPPNKYAFYKLKINNNHTDPLNITEAWLIAENAKPVARREMIPNPAPAIKQKDSVNHFTYVTVENRAPYLVNEIAVTAGGARFFEREFAVFIMASASDSEQLNYPVGNFLLSSSKPCIISIPAQKAGTILLVIDNKDSPPLHVTSVSTRQQRQYLITWLQAGKKYDILAGNEQAAAPQYDLGHFTDSVPYQLPELSFSAFAPINHVAASTLKPVANYWIWIIIIMSILVLSLFTFRLIKDVQRQGV